MRMLDWGSLALGLIVFSIGTGKIIFFGDWTGVFQVLMGAMVIGINAFVIVNRRHSEDYY